MIIEAVQPPKEMQVRELESPALKFPNIDIPSFDFGPLLPAQHEVETAHTVTLEAMETEEEPPEDNYVQRHRREAEIKPELGGLIW